MQLCKKLTNKLTQFEAEYHQLPGISDPVRRDVFIKQIIDSVRRIEYVSLIESRQIDARRIDPHNAELFDPLRAALVYKSRGEIDEACWLVFLLTHFGKHHRAGWRFVREVYGKLGEQPYWSWQDVSADPQAFRDWLRASKPHLMRGANRGFGNHRKYTSMDADKPNGTGAAVQTYVDWVLHFGDHTQLFANAVGQAGADRKRTFDWLYRSMSVVRSFARLGKFDYLTMLGKTGLAPIDPAFAYLAGSTGPNEGASRMYGTPGLSTLQKERRLADLAAHLNVNMQVIEDSLCNWSKSPDLYEYFSG
jgi:hypothetical protein